LNLLLDTHLLIWSATRNPKLTEEARSLISEMSNTVWFSTASLWETAIKNALKRPDFNVDVSTLRAGLLANGYFELAVEGRHSLTFRELSNHHRDPFDRMLVAQAMTEVMTLLTADKALASYGSSVRVV
jgi:PIN domain nuclease of toxin-antitoxin system